MDSVYGSVQDRARESVNSPLLFPFPFVNAEGKDRPGGLLDLWVPRKPTPQISDPGSTQTVHGTPARPGQAALATNVSCLASFLFSLCSLDSILTALTSVIMFW